jgi:hypothetical protein
MLSDIRSMVAIATFRMIQMTLDNSVRSHGGSGEHPGEKC